MRGAASSHLSGLQSDTPVCAALTPPRVRRHGKDAAKALRKRLTNGTAKTQLLALTVRPLAVSCLRLLTPSQALEAAVKNCGRRFHEIVAQKEALQAMAKLASSRKARLAEAPPPFTTPLAHSPPRATRRFARKPRPSSRSGQTPFG